MEHADVLIASPGLNFHYNYIESLTNTLNELKDRNISYRWLGGYSSLVNVAREIVLDGNIWDEEKTINAPLQGKVSYNKIFWIDSDIVWQPEDLFKLYDSDHEIISGVYVSRSSENKFKTNLYDKNLNNIIPKQSSIFEVFGAGFGFLAVKNGVFEKLERPWFRMLSDEKNETLGEDLSWCLRVQEEGCKIFVDTSVKVGHIKPMIFNPVY